MGKSAVMKKKSALNHGAKKNGTQDRHGLPRISGKKAISSLFEIESGKPEGGGQSFAEAYTAGYADHGLAVAVLKRLQEDEGGTQHAAPTARGISQKAVPEAELDLHGLRGREAEARTDSFIRASRRKGFKLVLIITGKGLHSPGRLPVLQDAVEARLRELKTEGLVRSCAWEKKTREDSGAILVNLV